MPETFVQELQFGPWAEGVATETGTGFKRRLIQAVSGATTYRFFRVRTTATPDGTIVSIAEFEAALVPAGASQLTGKTATSTSNFDGTTLPAKAVDGDLVTTFWASAGNSIWPQDLIIDMGVGNGITPYEFRITSRVGFGSQAPGSFTIDGGQDGIAWPHTFNTLVGETFTNNQTKTYIAA